MSFRELLAYKKSPDLAIEIFILSKEFPVDEKYSLTDQIRRSSRSVCANIGEAYRKRKYPKHFISKLSDSDAENTETQVWLDFCLSFKYINKEIYNQLIIKSEEVGKLINYMMANSEKFM
jgi:four helix bundle protein